MYRPGALRELEDQLQHLRMDITAIQETRWTGCGKQTGRNFDLFYSGSQDKHEFGTAFLVSKGMRKTVIDFQPINKRLCKLRLQGKKFNITVINGHAPTEEKDEDEKDQFYEELERIIDSSPSHDMKIVLGDFNAQIGKEPVFIPTIGKHSLHQKTNDNGERLISFATSRSLVIMSTIFPHKEKHKQTWTSPNGVATQIDHILVSNRHFNTIKDVRSFRGPDINSDHFLVATKINHAYRKIEYGNNRGNINWIRDRLKEKEVVDAFQKDVETGIRYIPTVIGGRDVNEEWAILRQILTEAANQHCKVERGSTSNKVWFDLECEEAVKARNEKRLKFLSRDTRQSRKEYHDARTNAKKVLRQKKRDALQARVRSVEEHRRNNETRKFFGEVNNIKSGFRNFCPAIKRSDGKLVFIDQDILNRWEEYFQELLNPREDEENPEWELIQDEDDLEVSPPDSEDISIILNDLKNNKAPGSDGIPGEFLKVGGPAMIEELTHLIANVWESEKMPDTWKESVVFPVLKKGDSRNCNNYRGISLLNTAYKVFSVALYNRLIKYVEPQLGEYQGGFRKNRSTIDQIFSLRQIMEKAKEFNKIIWILFIDFKSAYDSVIRKKLYLAMEELGIPSKLIRLTACTLKESVSRIKINGNVGQPFVVRSGVRQGDSLSPLLFNVILQVVVKRAELTLSGTIFNRRTQLLGYADDVAIVGTSIRTIEEACERLAKESEKMGLSINEEKTKIMVLRRKQSLNPTKQYKIGQFTFECVSSFKYLGSIINDRLDEDEEIRNRIIGANKAYWTLRGLLRSKLLSRTTKINLYKSMIRPILTYGCATWTLGKCSAERIDRFERKLLRRIIGPIKEEGVYRLRKNREVYKVYDDLRVSYFVRVQRIKWLGHILRMDNGRVAKLLYLGNPDGVRPRGRPKGRWKDSVAEDLRTAGISSGRATDRDDWGRAVEEAKGSFMRLSSR